MLPKYWQSFGDGIQSFMPELDRRRALLVFMRCGSRWAYDKSHHFETLKRVRKRNQILRLVPDKVQKIARSKTGSLSVVARIARSWFRFFALLTITC